MLRVKILNKLRHILDSVQRAGGGHFIGYAQNKLALEKLKAFKSLTL